MFSKKNQKLILWATIVVLLYIFIIKPMLKNTEGFNGNLNEGLPKLVNFNTSWCGYSKKLQPVWDQLAQEADTTKVEIIDLKCDTDSASEDLCASEGIQGYPSIRLYKNGQKIDYTGERSVPALKQFLQEHCY